MKRIGVKHSSALVYVKFVHVKKSSPSDLESCIDVDIFDRD